MRRSHQDMPEDRSGGAGYRMAIVHYRDIALRIPRTLVYGAVLLLVLPLPSLAGASGIRVTYHRGPLMRAAMTHVIFWLPRGRHFDGTHDGRYERLIGRFLGDVGGTRYYGIITGYARAPGFGPVVEGPVKNVSRLAGVFRDTHPYPSPGTARHPLTMPQLHHEIEVAMRKKGWTESLHDLYLVFVAKGVTACAELHGGCLNDSTGRPVPICATHQYFVPEDQPVVFAYLPVAASSGRCLPERGRLPSPNGDRVVDREIDVVARQLFDTVTDPVGTGWYDSSPLGEIGNLCHGVRVTTLRGHRYALPGIWNERLRACAVSGP